MDKHHAMVEFFRPKIEELSTEMNFNFSGETTRFSCISDGLCRSD